MKKLLNQRWQPTSGCGGLIITKFLIGKFLLPPPTGNHHQNSPELLLLKILPLSDHHSHLWASTFDFRTFLCCLFAWAAPFFLQFGCFCVDFTFNLYFCFYRLQLNGMNSLQLNCLVTDQTLIEPPSW